MHHDQNQNDDDPQQTTSDSATAPVHSLSLFMDLMERDLRVLQKDVRGIVDKLSEHQSERSETNQALIRINGILAEIMRQQAVGMSRREKGMGVLEVLGELAGRLDTAVAVLEDEVDNLRNPAQLHQENGIDDNKQSNDVETDSSWQFMIVRRDDFERLRKDVKRLKKRLK